jgi:hypothetical protein
MAAPSLLQRSSKRAFVVARVVAAVAADDSSKKNATPHCVSLLPLVSLSLCIVTHLVLSHLIGALRLCLLLRPLCLVGCRVVALYLVVASPCAVSRRYVSL